MLEINKSEHNNIDLLYLVLVFQDIFYRHL